MMRVLAEAGFAAQTPQGAYYVMADVSSLGFDDDVAAARHLVSEVGVAAVPGSSFFSRPELGSHLLRFAFPKQLATLEEAGRRLQSATRQPLANSILRSRPACRSRADDDLRNAFGRGRGWPPGRRRP